MQCRPGRIGPERGRKNIVRHLRRRSDNDNHVLEENAVGIIRVPEFRIENFVERPRRKRVGRAEADRMRLQIARDVLTASELFHRPSGE